MRLRKAISVNFLALALLVAYGDNEPSNSDIQKQLLNLFSPCPELSITNFQKINGYPQNDGSYIDQAQYNMVFTPSDKMLSYVTDYTNKQKSIVNDGTADTAKIQTAKDQINALACTPTYLSVIQDISSSVNAMFNSGGSFSNFENQSQANDEQIIDNDINLLTGYVKTRQDWLSNDETKTEWPWPHIRDDYGNMATMTKAQALEVDQKAIAEYQNDVNILKGIKIKLENSVDQLSVCQEKEQKIIQNNQDAFDHLQALNAQMVGVQSDDILALKNEMQNDCPIVAAAGFSALNADDGVIDDYDKIYTLTESRNVHLIKSDNGWVIQN